MRFAPTKGKAKTPRLSVNIYFEAKTGNLAGVWLIFHQAAIRAVFLKHLLNFVDATGGSDFGCIVFEGDKPKTF